MATFSPVALKRSGRRRRRRGEGGEGERSGGGGGGGGKEWEEEEGGRSGRRRRGRRGKEWEEEEEGRINSSYLWLIVSLPPSYSLLCGETDEKRKKKRVSEWGGGKRDRQRRVTQTGKEGGR